MPIDVECGFCFKQYKVRDDFGGKTVKCKECGGDLKVPTAAKKPGAVGKPRYKSDDEDDDDDGVDSYQPKSGNAWEDSFGPSNGGKSRPNPKKKAEPAVRTRSRSTEDDVSDDDDDRESARPKTFKKKKQSNSGPMILVGIVAAVVVLAIIIGISVAVFSGAKSPPNVGNNNPPPVIPGNNPPPFNPNPFPVNNGNNNANNGGFPRPNPFDPNDGFPKADNNQQAGFGSNKQLDPPVPNRAGDNAANPGLGAKENEPGLGAKKNKKKAAGGGGFQPVDAGQMADLEPWKVAVDPTTEPLVLDAEARVKVGFPKGSKMEVIYPLVPSTFVAVGSNTSEKEVREVRNLANNQRVGAVKGVKLHGTNWALSPDGTHLACWVLFDKAVRVWNVKTGKALGNLTFENGGFVKFVAFSDANRLLACGYDGAVSVWQIPSGSEERTFKLPSNVRDFAFAISPGGKYLAYMAGEHNKPILQVHDLAKGKIVGETLLSGEHVNPSSCTAIEFSPDGTEIALLFDNWKQQVLTVVAVENGEQVVNFGFENTVKDLPRVRHKKDRPLAWFPSKQRWLFGGVAIIDRQAEKLIWTMPGADRDLGSDYPTVARIVDDFRVLYAIPEGKESNIVSFAIDLDEVSQAADVVTKGGLAVDVRLPPLSKARYGDPPKLTVDGGSVAWGVGVDPIGVAPKGLLSKPFTLPTNEDPLRGARLAGPSAARLAILYGQDKSSTTSRRAAAVRRRNGRKPVAEASSTTGSLLGLVDLESREVVEEIDLPYHADLLSVTLDGKHACVRMQDGLTRLDIYDLDKGEQIAGWRPYGHFENEHDQRVKAAVFIDAKHMLTLSERDLLALWDLEKMTTVYQIENARTPVVTPGRHVLAVSNGKGYRFMNALTGNPVGEIVHPQTSMLLGGLGFHPAGDRVAATIQAAGGVRLVNWDLRTGNVISEFPVPTSASELKWCGNDHVLLDNRSLVDMKKKMLVWTYSLPTNQGVHLGDSPDGRHWYLNSSGGQNASVTVTAVDLPHPAAEEKLAATKLEPEYILKPGMKVSVRFNFAQTPPGKQNLQQEVWKNLQKKLEANGLTVVDNEKIFVYVFLTHKMTGENHSFRINSFGRAGGGPREVNVAGEQVECGLQIWQGDKVVWDGKTTYGNGAFFLHLKDGESVEQHLKDQMWNGTSNMLLNLDPPKYVFTESAAKGIGQSLFTADGVR